MRLRLQLSFTGDRGPSPAGTRPIEGADVNTQMKVGAYLVGLAVVFAAAVGLGRAVGPVGPAGDPAQLPAETEIGHGGMDMDGRGG